MAGDDTLRTSLKSFLNLVGAPMVDKEKPEEHIAAVLQKIVQMREESCDWVILFDDLREQHNIEDVLKVISGLSDLLNRKRIQIVITTRQQLHKFKNYDEQALNIYEMPSALDEADAKAFLKSKMGGEFSNEMIAKLRRKISLLPLHLQLFACLLKEDEASPFILNNCY